MQVMLLRLSWAPWLRGLCCPGTEGSIVCACAGSRRDLAAAGFPAQATGSRGNLRHPMCGSRPLRRPSRVLTPGAPRWGLCRLPAHLVPQEAVLSPPPFPGSKSRSLFLRSPGCRPAVRRPDGTAPGGSPAFPASLLAADGALPTAGAVPGA